MIKSKIIGIGSHLPSKILLNQDLEKLIDTSDEWIKSRTGIAQRHIAENQSLTELALKAAKAAILDANIKLDQIDLIINCSTTSEHIFPGTAVKLQSALNLKATPAFDVQAVCSGFIYGLDLADGLIKSRKYKTIMLTCTEKMSKLLNWQDRNTCILFGDGAGCIILQQNSKDSGIIDSHIYSDGSFYDLLYADPEGIKMNGREVFKHAVEKMGDSAYEILKNNGLTTEHIKYFIPHQANIRIIESLASRLNIDMDKIIITITKHANCSAASIPLALDELKKSGKLNTGDIILFSAFGAGFMWGSALVAW